MTPEDRRALIEKPFPTVQVVQPVARHAGTVYAVTPGASYRPLVRHADAPDDQDYFSNAVVASLTEQERVDYYRCMRNKSMRHIVSCGRVR